MGPITSAQPDPASRSGSGGDAHMAGPAPDMLPVDEAIARIVREFAPLADHERVSLADAVGRVLVEDVPADTDLPPFSTTAMDGYAVRAGDVATATRETPVTLRVIGEAAAGSLHDEPLGEGEALRIFTGAPMPAGADCVVPYELTDGRGFGGWAGEDGARDASLEREVRIFAALPPEENVRHRGEVSRKGGIVLRSRSVLRAGEIAVLATFGRSAVFVYRRPRVAILSTGDELVSVDDAPGPGQIRDGNGPGLAALVRQYGGVPVDLGIVRDDPVAVREALQRGVRAGVDLLLTSGGVSMGTHDVVKHVIRDNGEVDFWSIDVRPGKPLAFGRFGGVRLFGLPGNPVSALVTFELFVRPALLRLGGHVRVQKPVAHAVALETIRNGSGRENYMRGIVEPLRHAVDGAAVGGPQLAVRLTGEQGSNHITSMARANVLVRLGKSQRVVSPGEVVPVLLLDSAPLW